jgi:hypothetical protein
MAEELVAELEARSDFRFAAEGLSKPVAGNRLGTVLTTDMKNAMVLAGYGYHVTVGALTTPIVGGGGDGGVPDIAQSELSIAIPSGTAIRILRGAIQVEAQADADAVITEAFIAVDRATASTASPSTGTAETVYNMRTDAPRSTACTVVSANTTPHNTAVHHLELARKQLVVNIVTSGITQGIVDLVYEPKTSPVIVGPASVFFHWGSSAGSVSGFADAEWLEYPAGLGDLFGGN